MVERIYQEKQIIYENSGSNPWYTLLDKIADAIVELCGAEITNKGSGNVTLTIPEFPGVLYMTATSGTSSGYFYMYLRGKDSSRNLFDTYSAYISSQKGSVTVGYTSIGGFLNCIFFGPTALPNEDYWCAAWWGWFIRLPMTKCTIYTREKVQEIIEKRKT